MSDKPQAGKPISMEDLTMIFEALRERSKKNPNELGAITFWLVLSGIGERFREIQCVEQEWKCLKKDIPKTEGAPTCPNGHGLREGHGLTIGWVAVE